MYSALITTVTITQVDRLIVELDLLCLHLLDHRNINQLLILYSTGVCCMKRSYALFDERRRHKWKATYTDCSTMRSGSFNG